MQELLDQGQREIERLHTEATAQASNASLWKERAEQFDLEIEGLRGEVATLTPALESAEVSVQEEQALRAAVEAEQEQLRSTVKQLDLLRIGLEGAVEKLKEQVQGGTLRFQESEAGAARTQEELAAASQRIRLLEGGEEELREAVSRARSGRGELDAAIQTERAQVDEFKKRSTEFERRWRRAEARLESESASRIEMERHGADQATKVHELESRVNRSRR